MIKIMLILSGLSCIYTIRHCHTFFVILKQDKISQKQTNEQTTHMYEPFFSNILESLENTYLIEKINTTSSNRRYASENLW